MGKNNFFLQIIKLSLIIELIDRKIQLYYISSYSDHFKNIELHSKIRMFLLLLMTILNNFCSLNI